MIRNIILAAIALPLALALAPLGTALAHHPSVGMSPHEQPHAAANQFAQAAPGQQDSIRELQRQRANPNVPPGVQAQRRDAADADAASVDDAAAQLSAAITAIRAGRGGQANEFLERAESRLLTRSTLATRAGEAVQDGPIARVSAARAALMRNDRAGAQREVEAALVAIDRPASTDPANRRRP